MNDFKYNAFNKLMCEDTPLNELEIKFKTPLFVYSAKTLLNNIKKLKQSLKEINVDIHYALKANSTLGIISLLKKEGIGADIVSEGELKRAIKVGINPNKIVFSGVGKTYEEITLALKHNIKQINVESLPELEHIIKISQNLNVRAPVALRVNPDITVNTHKKIATGNNQAKFGIPAEQIFNLYKKICEERSLLPKGLAIHIGSQIFNNLEFRTAYKFLLHSANELRKNGFDVPNLDLGGGIGVNHSNSKVDFDGFSKEIINIFKGTNYKLSIEPGRSIVATSSILLTKVIYVKKIKNKNFVIVDAAMNDFIRPTLYDAFHPIIPVKLKKSKEFVCDIVGPICETGDYFLQNTKLQEPNINDLLAISNTGAYGSVMSSNYNSRSPAAEVMVFQGKTILIKHREQIEEQINREIII